MSEVEHDAYDDGTEDDLPDEGDEDEGEVFESLGDAPVDEDIPEDEGDAGEAEEEKE